MEYKTDCPQCPRIAWRPESNEVYPYCSRKCFDAAIDKVIERDNNQCDIRNQIIALRDDAESRVANINRLGTNKLNTTKNYFQARADVLNDILMVMDAETDCSCY